jgi:hypothetical protein
MAFSGSYNTTNPGSAVSNRESLSNVLTILAPEETPITSSLKKQKINATYHEWSVDGLAAVSTAGISEGAPVTSYGDAFSGRARIGNYIQKFRKAVRVSDLQEASDSVGPARFAQAEAKSLRELKRNVEATLMSSNDRAAEDGASQPYKLRGLGDWIDSAGPSDVPAAYRTPADSIYTQAEATATPFSETSLNDLLTSTFRVTGTSNSLMLVADTKLRRSISDYSRVIDTGVNDARKVEMSDGDTTINSRVDLYQSDHGIVSIVNMNPDCSPNTTDRDVGFLLNPDYLGIGEYIPTGSTRQDEDGGGPRGFVDCSLTLICEHPGAHGKIDAIA